VQPAHSYPPNEFAQLTTEPDRLSLGESTTIHGRIVGYYAIPDERAQISYNTLPVGHINALTSPQNHILGYAPLKNCESDLPSSPIQCWDFKFKWTPDRCGTFTVKVSYIALGDQTDEATVRIVVHEATEQKQTAEMVTPAPASTIKYRVKQLSPSAHITVGDHSLEDWNDSYIMMAIPPHKAPNQQWKNIRGRDPKPTTGEGDIDVLVYMAWDAQYWYIAAKIMDDHIIEGTHRHPYSGDCLEIFFAGDQFDSNQDYSHNVRDNGSQAVFLQVELSPLPDHSDSDWLSTWRTDSGLKDKINQDGLISRWKDSSSWQAEARIPLSAFENDVRTRILQRSELRMAIDYLDYDLERADRSPVDDWGFHPDNVFCLDPAEKFVNVPLYMPKVLFE